MSLAVAVLMDPIGAIKPAKDTTLALLLEAQRRRHRLFYVEHSGLAADGARARARMAPLTVRDDPADWFSIGTPEWRDLVTMDVLLLRKDPPFDNEYLYDTQLAELAQREGVLVVNDPKSLRDANEKLFALHFPQCCPPTLVARDAALLRGFVEREGRAVLKPLDGMGGRGVFQANADDPNLNVILETLTNGGRTLAMVQRYLPEIVDGDKRILMIDGEPVPYALARIPQGHDFRGNLARGGRGEARPLSDRDRWIASQVGPELRRRGLLFVGLDVIGEWLTEVNVTSPTGVRELDAQCGLNVAGLLWDAVAARLDAGRGARAT
ncbi:glutathione synthase [Pseudofulvimonas gallinarii]|nr:glutathione synthase [Pseudofulvimonas gallinarii]THD12043.1 glutathione synthase [Pseudofulvimonas gallinarii]